MNNIPLVLIILDGWGISKESKGNAIFLAKTPVVDNICKKYSHTHLHASGHYVGLPDGQPGNSEAGHMNIGAGRVIPQDSIIINKSIKNSTFFKNPAFLQTAQHITDNNSDIHLMGLLSENQSPHSDNDHIVALIDFFTNNSKQNIYLHLFTDGRDSPMFSALKTLDKYKKVFDNKRVKIASIMGRFYAMDRKRDWQRTKLTYEAMTEGKGVTVTNGIEAVNQAYNRGESDEFILPTVIVDKNKKPIGPINDNDAIVFFNLRSDRARQLSKTFVQKNFEKDNKDSFKRKKKVKNLFFTALTDFGTDLGHILTAYPAIDIPESLTSCLKEYRQLYIAESEKYSHVTYFFNGGYDQPVVKEERISIPSKNISTYDQKPSMSVKLVTNKVIKAIQDKKFDFITLNYASPDMIGHTGNIEAAIKAIEIVDKEIGKIISEVSKRNGTVIITADHGNVEEMINNETGEVITKHSTNLVPFAIINKHKYKLGKIGKLADIAPTILDILDIKKPKSMTGKSLIKK